MTAIPFTLILADLLPPGGPGTTQGAPPLGGAHLLLRENRSGNAIGSSASRPGE